MSSRLAIFNCSKSNEKYSKFYQQRSKNQNLDSFVSSSFDIGGVSYSIDTLDLQQVVAKLTPQYRQVIEWMYFNGYTQQEISDEFNIPLGTVKTRTRLGMNELRQHFGLI